MSSHQRAEQPPVPRHPEVQQLVRDDEVLETLILVGEVRGQGDGASRRA